MPDCLSKKIDQLSTILAPYGARKVSTNELSKFNDKYVCAWELVTDLEFSNEPIVFQMCLFPHLKLMFANSRT